MITPPSLSCNSVKLKHFAKFADMKEALAAGTALVEGKLSKGLKKVLRTVVAADLHEQLAVADTKLGGAIKVRPSHDVGCPHLPPPPQDKLHLSCVHSSAIDELFRGIRLQIDSLITGGQESILCGCSSNLISARSCTI